MIGPSLVDMTREELIVAVKSANTMRQYYAAQANVLQKQLDDLKSEGATQRSLESTFGIITSISEDGEWLLQLAGMIRRHVEKNKPASIEKSQDHITEVALHYDLVSFGDSQTKNEIEYEKYTRQPFKQGIIHFPESDRAATVKFISFGVNGIVIGSVPVNSNRAVYLLKGIAPAVNTTPSPIW